ncbi:tetratricopeptide repeat protein [Pantanalinema rosaneae CENA516]|uniref:tetratricopeptide repeat protein n=1 Tax=Pantanalinema rosaneae TaxID=1620701 RepID=UPI003D6F883F
MKKRKWLNVAEYCLLVGSGIGSLAALASQQILLLYTAAPVSVLLLLLNLISRQQIEETAQETTANSVSQLNQKLSSDINALQQQVQAMPSVFDLASLRKSVLAKNQEALAELAQSVGDLQREFARPEWRLLHQEVKQVQDHYTHLSATVAGITESLNRLGAAARLGSLEDELTHLRTDLAQVRNTLQTLDRQQQQHYHKDLQAQIDQLNRRFNKLPPPFDATTLKQDIDSLIRVIGDLASRRDLSRVESQLLKLNQQNSALEQSVTPLKVATTILRKQVDTVSAKLTHEGQDTETIAESPIETQVVEELKATIASLEQRLEQLATATTPTQLQTEIQGIVSAHLTPLQQQLSAVHQVNQTIDRQQQELRDWVNRLPQLLDSAALQNEVKYLAGRVEWTESALMDLQTQVDTAIETRLDEVMQQLQTNQPVPKYELVFDVQARSRSTSPALPAPTGCGSRAMLEEALDRTQARLVVVYPYPSPATLDDAMIQKFRQFLDRQGCLDIGWGHLGDVTSRHTARPIDRRRAIDPAEKGFLYTTLNQLTQLKKQYPDRFRFKVLGTDENFLVCDRSFAILGSQSVATASVVFPEAVVGLKTTDATVIQGLIQRFDDPELDAEDTTAYFHRAATRYDLGDRPGAIADYTEVLRITPNDDIAYNNRGLAHYDLADRQAAIADLTLAIQANPENFIAYCNRGVIRSELGDKLGAIEDYTAAIHLNPDYTTAYFYRGLARTRMQNKLGAIQDYTQVIRLNPQDASAYFYRGLACIKIGHRLEAIKDLRQAAQLFKEQGDTANYKQTVQAIKKLHKTLVIAGSGKPMVSNGA